MFKCRTPISLPQNLDLNYCIKNEMLFFSASTLSPDLYCTQYIKHPPPQKKNKNKMKIKQLPLRIHFVHNALVRQNTVDFQCLSIVLRLAYKTSACTSDDSAN